MTRHGASAPAGGLLDGLVITSTSASTPGGSSISNCSIVVGGMKGPDGVVPAQPAPSIGILDVSSTCTRSMVEVVLGQPGQPGLGLVNAGAIGERAEYKKL